jgi:hypothetical protein
VQEEGTHSILDMFRVLTEDEQPEHGTVEPVTDGVVPRLPGSALWWCLILLRG